MRYICKWHSTLHITLAYTCLSLSGETGPSFSVLSDVWKTMVILEWSGLGLPLLLYHTVGLSVRWNFVEHKKLLFFAVVKTVQEFWLNWTLASTSHAEFTYASVIVTCSWGWTSRFIWKLVMMNDELTPWPWAYTCDVKRRTPWRRVTAGDWACRQLVHLEIMV